MIFLRSKNYFEFRAYHLIVQIVAEISKNTIVFFIVKCYRKLQNISFQSSQNRNSTFCSENLISALWLEILKREDQIWFLPCDWNFLKGSVNRHHNVKTWKNQFFILFFKKNCVWTTLQSFWAYLKCDTNNFLWKIDTEGSEVSKHGYWAKNRIASFA